MRIAGAFLQAGYLLIPNKQHDSSEQLLSLLRMYRYLYRCHILVICVYAIIFLHVSIVAYYRHRDIVVRLMHPCPDCASDDLICCELWS